MFFGSHTGRVIVAFGRPHKIDGKPPWDASRRVFAEIVADAPAMHIAWKQVDVNPLLTASLS